MLLSSYSQFRTVTIGQHQLIKQGNNKLVDKEGTPSQRDTQKKALKQSRSSDGQDVEHHLPTNDISRTTSINVCALNVHLINPKANIDIRHDGSDAKLLVCFQFRKRIHTSRHTHLDGKKLDMGVLLLRCLHAGDIRRTAFNAK